MLALRLVVDVLVSAALKPDGLQRTTFLLAITKPGRLYVSTPVLEEYAEDAVPARIVNSERVAATTASAHQEPRPSGYPLAPYRGDERKLWMAETTRSVRTIPPSDKRQPADETEIRVSSAEILFDNDGALWITSVVRTR